MSTNIVPHVAGQAVAVSIDELAARVCKAHAGFFSSACNAVMHAIDAGQALIAAKKLTPHGQWGKFVQRCEIGERQAVRYMRLARLVEANPTCKSDLASLTIESAIKKLSSPKSPTTKRRRSAPKIIATPNAISNAPATHLDIVSDWMASTPAERTKAIHAIGLEPLLAAIPDAWWSMIKERVADRCGVTVSAAASDPTSDDLEIPEFLRREPRNSIAIESEELANSDNVDEVEEDGQREPKRTRKVKQIEHTTEIGDAIGHVFNNLQELASECQDAADNAPDNLRETEKFQILESSACELESVDKPEPPAALSELPVKFTLPKRRYNSRDARASDAIIILEACVQVLNGISNGDAGHADAQMLIGDLRSAIVKIDSCEFPGAY